jgi:3-oxoacyl-[acyl-carrier-protein] synthase-3
VSRHVAITGVGSATPGWVLDNEALIAHCGLDVSPEWIVSRTGIASRHWLEPERTTSDLAAEAVRAILADAGVAPEEVDRLVFATVSPDLPTPATATRVLAKTGMRCPAFDLAATCAGFLYGLELGAAAIRGGSEKVLVLCAEARSRFIDTTNRRAAVLFADGAAGVLLEPADTPGVLDVVIGAEGMEMLAAYVPAGGAAEPLTPEGLAAGRHQLHVDGRNDIFQHFLRLTQEAVDGVLARTGLTLDDIDLLVPHQGNARLTEAIADLLGMPRERTANTITHHGNVSGASIPLALADLRASGRLQPGQTALLVAVGAGAAFGAAVVRLHR